MEKDIIVYYSKRYKFKWFVSLAILSALYILIFFFTDISVFVGIHFLFLFYMVLITISLLKPYLQIKDNKIKSSNYMFKTLKLDKLNEVTVSEHNYIFKENRKYLFIDLDLVSREDRKCVISFLKDKKLLEDMSDSIKNREMTFQD